VIGGVSTSDKEGKKISATKREMPNCMVRKEGVNHSEKKG